MTDDNVHTIEHMPMPELGLVAVAIVHGRWRRFASHILLIFYLQYTYIIGSAMFRQQVLHNKTVVELAVVSFFVYFVRKHTPENIRLERNIRICFYSFRM